MMDTNTNKQVSAGIPWGMILALSVPGSLAAALLWLGPMTFVNLFITRQLGNTDMVWTTLSLWFIGGNIGGGLLTGLVVPKLGGRQTVSLCYLAGAGGYLVFAFLPTLGFVGLGLAICGLAAGLGMTAATSLLLGAVNEQAGRAISASNIVGGVIGMAAFVLAGKVVQMHGYARFFLLCAGVLAACAVAFWKATRPFRRQLDSVHETSVLDLRQTDWRALSASGCVLLLCLGVLAEPFIFHTSNQLLANLLHGCYGKDEEFVGTVTGLGRVCGAVGALTLGMMFEWLLPHRRWGLGMILAGGCIAGMGLVGTAAMVVTLQMLFQWVYPLIWCGNSVAIVETMGRERRSVALSLMTAIMQTGTLATGIVHRLLLGASVSVPHVFVLCGATGVLVGAILFSRRRRLAAVQC